MRLNRDIDLKCFHCNNKRATVRVKYEVDDVELNLCLCEDCIALGEQVVVEGILNK